MTTTLKPGITTRGEGHGRAERKPLPQYSLAQILGVWAGAALPMAALAWLGVPLLAAAIQGPAAWPQAILIALTTGLIWQFALVLILVRREQGTLRWSVLKDALWLRAPRSPKTGRTGGLLWLLVIPLAFLVYARELLPKLPAPAGRDLGDFLQSPDRAGVLLRQLDLVRADARHVPLQHRAGRGAALPRSAPAPDAGGVRPARLARERGPVRAVPLACAVGDPGAAGERVHPVMAITSVSERTTRDHRAQLTEHRAGSAPPAARPAVM